MFSIGVDNEKALELDNKANFLILSSIFKDFLHLVLDFLLKKKKVTVGGKNHYYATNRVVVTQKEKRQPGLSDPCFQNKNSGCRLTGRLCFNNQFAKQNHLFFWIWQQLFFWIRYGHI